MTKRHDGPKWVRLLSWIAAGAVWLWIVNGLVIRDLPAKIVGTNSGAELLVDSLFVLAVATLLAAFAMILVRLIEWRWMK